MLCTAVSTARPLHDFQSPGGRRSNNPHDAQWRSRRRRQDSTEPRPRRSVKFERSAPRGHRMSGAAVAATRKTFVEMDENNSTKRRPKSRDRSCSRSNAGWGSPSCPREFSRAFFYCVEVQHWWSASFLSCVHMTRRSSQAARPVCLPGFTQLIW